MTIQEHLAEKAAGLPALIGRFRAELKANRRAALGLLAIGCLVGCYGLMVFDDAVAAQRERYVEAAHRLERLVASAQDKAWPARAAVGARMRKSLEARLWKGDSEGIVLADLQDWVTNQGRQAGLKRVQVNLDVAKPKGFPADFRQVTATITALDTAPSLITFLDRIQREPRLLVVDHLQVRERPVSSMEMKLIAYTVVKADEPPAK